MAGQNRQRRSELQRHRLYRDVCALARAGLVLFREARPAEGRAGGVIARSTESARPRRECRASRRCPLRTSAVARARRRGEIVYAGEGMPLIIAPSAVFKTALSPNAARLFQSFLFSIEAQQRLVDASGMCSFHRLVKEKSGRRPLSTIKLMKSDSEAIEAQREDIKARYRSIFGALTSTRGQARFTPDCVAKLFCPSERVRLIQEQASMCNVNSRIHSL